MIGYPEKGLFFPPVVKEVCTAPACVGVAVLVLRKFTLKVMVLKNHDLMP